MNVEFKSEVCEGKPERGQADGAISAWWGESGGAWWPWEDNREGYASSGGESHSEALKAEEQGMRLIFFGAALYLTLTLLSIAPFPYEKGPEIGRTILTLVTVCCWGGVIWWKW